MSKLEAVIYDACIDKTFQILEVKDWKNYTVPLPQREYFVTASQRTKRSGSYLLLRLEVDFV